jgi:hypothetical protein
MLLTVILIFLVFVPLPHEVAKAISLLQKYTVRYFDPATVEEGAVIERDAVPVVLSQEILEPTGVQAPD